MKKLNKFIFIFFFIIGALQGKAQIKGLVLSDYYSSEDYNAGPQNWCITQDQRGIMYFGNSNCILEYDGVSWQKIYVENQSNVRSLAVDKQNNIFVGAYNEIGILTPDNQGHLQYKSLTHLINPEHSDFGDVWNTYCIDEEVFFLTEKFVFRLKNQQMDCWERSKERFYLSFNVNNQLYINEVGKGLMVFEGNSLKLVQKGEFFADKRIHTMLPLGEKLLIGTRRHGLYLYHQTQTKAEIRPISQISEAGKSLNKYFIENTLYHGIKMNDQLFALATIKGTVLTVDANFNVIDIIDKESTGIISPVYYLFFDTNETLWLALDNGINRVDIYSPFRYWTEDLGIIGNITDVASLDEYTYIATGSGIYYSKNKNDINQDYEVNHFYPVMGSFEQTWGFLYFFIPDIHLKKNDENILQKLETLESPSSDEALLLIATSRGLFQIKKNYSKQISNYQRILKIYQYNKDPSKVVLGLVNGVAILDYANGQWVNLGKPFDINEQIRSVEEDSLGNLWLSVHYKGLYEIKNPFHKDHKPHQVVFHGEDKGLPSTKAIEMAHYNNQLLFISDMKYFTYDCSTDSFVLAKDIFPSENNSADQDTVQEESSSDTLSIYKLYDKIITPFYVTTFTDSSIWFGTTDGTFRYRNNFTKDYFTISPPILRQVSTIDSVIYYGTNFSKIQNPKDTLIQVNRINPAKTIDIGTVLNYENNSLTFQFAFPFYDEESGNLYSYFLKGFDKKWSEWTTETKREYINLREGDYVFNVKAKNIYNVESEPALFKFKILPPWYRSFAAILGYIIFGIILIIGIVRLYTYRLIREKDKLEKIVIQRTQEILMQKEEILVQAEHLKDANERISKKNNELEKQKWEITNQAIQLRKANIELLKLSKVASETDNAIGIFDKDGNIEWVNNAFTKMYGYTLDQYKKEKYKNIKQSSDNPNIKQAIDTCINESKSIVYEFKTKSREGKELWAQTTLTPVVDKDGKTINLIAIDSDITKLKQAEKEIIQQKKEIEQQRDKLAVSNATKNKFFRIIAHDLRNPISTLVSSTNVVFNDFDTYNREQTKNIIAQLNRLSQTTFNLLENLLDWSSSQTGEIIFNPKPVDIYFVVIENVELIKRKIEQKKIKLITELPEHFIAYADEDMIKAVVRNLLSNAVKFTPDKGTIEILAKSFNDTISITVKDTGIGIDPNDLPKLFRIDQHHTTPGLSNEKGSGLGLILCKEFVEKNGGTITIDSIPGKGTAITFTLKKHQA